MLNRHGLALVSLLFASMSNATAATYSLDPLPFTILGGSDITGAISTDVVGNFSGVSNVQNILNNSFYSFSIVDSTSQVRRINNANSSWSIDSDGRGGESVNLLLDGSRMSLSLNTPTENSWISLSLVGMDTRFYFSQFNNLFSPGATVGFNSPSVEAAYASVSYGSPIEFSATAAAVPEPASVILVAMGLGLVGAAAAKRKKKHGASNPAEVPAL